MKKIFVIVMICVLVISAVTLSACDAFGGKGEAGVGIESIEKTGKSGLVDTYTITMTDGSTSTFTVTNGKDGASSAANSDTTPDEYFRFKLLENGTYAVYARYVDMPMRTVIPATYQGKAVAILPRESFNGRESMDELVIPKSVVKIESGAFYDYENFYPEIVYLGTIEEWNAIEIDDNRAKNVFVIHCTDGDIVHEDD